jgi:uncharacterized coiled-coil protein SlyX
VKPAHSYDCAAERRIAKLEVALARARAEIERLRAIIAAEDIGRTTSHGVW